MHWEMQLKFYPLTFLCILTQTWANIKFLISTQLN